MDVPDKNGGPLSLIMEDFQKLVWSCFWVSNKHANLFETRTKHRIEWWNAKTLTLPPLSQVCEDWSLQSLGRLLLGELDGPFGSWLVVEGGCGFLVLADLFRSVLVLVLAFSCCECAHYESLICIQWVYRVEEQFESPQPISTILGVRSGCPKLFCG